MKFEPHRTIKYYLLKLLRLKGEPQFLARGVAVGIFIGITPTIPFHTILAILLALLLRGSKIAALLSTVLVSNPLTIFFQYYLSFRLGNFLTGGSMSWEKINHVLETLSSDLGFMDSIAALGELSQQTIITMLIGGAFMALPSGLLGYYMSLSFFTSLRNNKRLNAPTDNRQ